MNAIENYALLHGEINKQNLVFILDALQECDYKFDVNNILAILLGLVDPVSVKNQIPEFSMQMGGKKCTFKNYDLLRNRVEFTYDDVAVRWFKSQEDVNKFESGESYYNLDYKYSEKDNFTFKGTRHVVLENSCPLYDWMQDSVLA